AVARAVRLQVVGVDSAARDRALEVRDEERAGIGGVQAGARIVVDAGRAVLDVGDGGENVGRLALMALVPEPLHVPGTAFAEGRKLVSDPPAAVAPLHDMHET